jgi:hypothetical protein
MLKNILFLMGALILITILWWLYQYIGDYIFLAGLVALLCLIISDAKTRFGKK